MITVVLLAAAGSSDGATGMPRAAATGQAAAATLQNTAGEEVGTVRFSQQGDKVLVEVQVRAMPAGFHGFHVHAAGRCDATAAFETAGPHLGPPGALHDDHPGDFPTLLVGSDGTADVTFITDRFTVQGLFDGDGSAVIVHANADNHANIPARYAPEPDSITLDNGDSGGRIACGVVR